MLSTFTSEKTSRKTNKNTLSTTILGKSGKNLGKFGRKNGAKTWGSLVEKMVLKPANHCFLHKRVNISYNLVTMESEIIIGFYITKYFTNMDRIF